MVKVMLTLLTGYRSNRPLGRPGMMWNCVLLEFSPMFCQCQSDMNTFDRRQSMSLRRDCVPCTVAEMMTPLLVLGVPLAV